MMQELLREAWLNTGTTLLFLSLTTWKRRYSSPIAF